MLIQIEHEWGKKVIEEGTQQYKVCEEDRDKFKLTKTTNFTITLDKDVNQILVVMDTGDFEVTVKKNRTREEILK